MNRDEKAQAIEEIAADIEAAEAIFAVDYRGISVTQAAELRGKLREADASFRVVKNRLTKIAAEKVGEDRLGELLQGPTALTFVRGDTAQAAKAISTFNKEHAILTFKGGFMDATGLDEDRFKSIARLPGRDVLHGQFAGVVASPLTGLVRGLGSMIQGLASQLGQIAEKGLVSGAPPAGPVAGEDSSSSQGAGEEPNSTPPADETSEADSSDEPDAGGGQAADDGDAGPADAPVEEEPTESGAEAEPPADEPSQAEGDEGDAEPAGNEADRETSETDDDDSSKEEE